MKEQDETTQELIEKGVYTEGDIGHRAYRVVFNGVKKTPNFSLPSNFAENVIQRISQLREDRAIRKDFFWLALGLLVFLIATIITIGLSNFKFDTGAFGFIKNYGGLLLFGGLLILGLQWLDKKILSNKMAS